MFVLLKVEGRIRPVYSNSKFVCIGCGKPRFEMRVQPVKPAERKPEVRVPSGSYEEWISRRVRKELESGVEGADS